jgi:rod shape-determining protein MreD
MKNNFFILFLIVLGIILQVSGFPVLFSHGYFPSIVLVGVIAATIIWGFKQTLLWIIVAGIIFDLATFGIVGKQVIVLVAVAYFVSFFSKRFLVENRGLGIITIIFLVLLATLIFKILIFLFAGDGRLISTPLFFLSFGKEAFFNLLMFFIIFHFLKKNARSSLEKFSFSR